MEEDYYVRGRTKIGLLSFCRDVLIAKLPEGLRFVTRRLLPDEPDFIFYTHPRNEEDIYATMPFIRTLARFLPKKVIRSILNLGSCYVVARVKGPGGKMGYFISVTELPDSLFASRELVFRLVERSLSFFRKISRKKVFVGLAAWWPIVTNSGQVFQKHVNPNGNIKVTSGHTATLASMYLSIIKLCEICDIPLRNLRLLIIGVGKIGGTLAELFSEKIGALGLLDKNALRIQAVKKIIEGKSGSISVELIPVNDRNLENTILSKLQQYHLTVCTTSNTGLLVKDPRKLRNCLILDDSRPEAFPRIFSTEQRVAVLEGGLMKIPQVHTNSDFGFGKRRNIFGCLSEAIILSLDGGRTLVPNVGDIDQNNLFKLIEFCNQNNITEGDFKSGHRVITSEELGSLFSASEHRL